MRGPGLAAITIIRLGDSRKRMMMLKKGGGVIREDDRTPPPPSTLLPPSRYPAHGGKQRRSGFSPPSALLWTIHMQEVRYS